MIKSKRRKNRYPKRTVMCFTTYCYNDDFELVVVTIKAREVDRFFIQIPKFKYFNFED